MKWQHCIAKLAPGEIAQIRPRGHSMEPKISSGDFVTIEPIADQNDLEKGNIVLCKVKGRYYVHLIQAITRHMSGNRFQIGNNKNHTNGTIGFNNIFGKVTKVES
jgi:SOS-response transcriptional repressor LexA